jgi:putative glycosyltransferase
MTREYVDALLQHKEVNVFLAGLLEITGFVQKPIKIVKIYKQKTSYTFPKKFDLALTSLISFSGRPLRFIAALGACIVLIALILLATLIARNFFFEDSAQGWLSIVTILILFGGIQILSIGMVAIYVASILEEVKARPRTIISKIWPEE